MTSALGGPASVALEHPLPQGWTCSRAKHLNTSFALSIRMRVEDKDEQKVITNEYGEEFTNERLKQLARRVRTLSRKDIDELWYRVGWISFSGREDQQKALPTVVIDSMKKSLNSAKQQVEFLLLETREANFLKNLSVLDKRKSERKEPSCDERGSSLPS